MQLIEMIKTLVARLVLCLITATGFAVAQPIYFHQDFEKTVSLVNPQPDTGQFSHIILTAPQLSYHKFYKGYMELVRTRQDSATGGIIRALRATPFSPNAKSLFIQVTLSAQSVHSEAINAIYFYIGENFDPVNNSFPGNGLMFGRVALNFNGNTIALKDLETQKLSESIALKEQFTLTWVLNNSETPLPYQVFPTSPETQVAPGTYDLWVNEKVVSQGSKSYPGNSEYSGTKLSNFEMRFRNGLGKIRIHDLMIRGLEKPADPEGQIIMPNPVRDNSFVINSKKVRHETLKLSAANGNEIPFKSLTDRGKIRIQIPEYIVSGMYILSYQDLDRKNHAVRLLIE